MAYGCFDINKIWDKNTESPNAELTTGNSFITILFRPCGQVASCFLLQ